MKFGAPYVMEPGARLFIGPHGLPEESVGACCASCASGGRCASLGSIDSGTGLLLTLGALGLLAWVFRKK